MSSEDYVNVGDEEVKPLMVSVTAPASLPAGYTFEALLNDDPSRPFLCEVVRRKINVLLHVKQSLT
jgi:hypothetical protein